MLDIAIVGPIVTVLAILDVIIHLKLDLSKIQRTNNAVFTEPSTSIPSLTMTSVVISTLLSFGIVLVIIIAWVLNLPESLFSVLILIYDPPPIIWTSGLLLLILGILLHIWSRFVRQDMASSWAMSKQHILITEGPYSQIRHPSYTSYFLSFLGLLLLLPSVLSIVLLIGIPGYYGVTIYEEQYLITQFGDDYKEYKSRSGRFLPFPRTGNPD